MNTINNIDGLRAELAELFFNLKAKKLLPNLGKEMNNSAGKIMQSVKLELEYASLRKEKPDIAFLRASKAAR